MSNIFILSWDNTGLEACINVSEIEKNSMWATLQDQKPEVSIGPIISHLMMRARYNSQRHYEIYTIHVDDSVSEQDLRDMFEATPQQAADLIRERGRKIYSDRVDQKQVVIT